MANFISYLLCFCCTVQTVYSLCVIGTDCSVHVILSTGDLVTIKPQIDIQQSVGCVVNASATAVDRNSRSTFPVTANTSAVTVQLETTDDDHPHKYVIDLTYSIATNEDCPSNSTFGVTLHQTIEVNIVGPPTIHHSTNSPHTLLCITNTNTTATWIRFERGEDILGYCAPTKQIFDGDYKIFYPLTSDTDCVLQLAGNQVGVYVCSVKYPTIDSYLTSVESVTIDKENDNYTVIALSVVVGLLVITIAVLIVICTVIVWKRNNRPEPLNDEQPLQG